jgi:Fe-S-cluster containining protein
MSGMQATEDDIKRWKREKRRDILAYAYIYKAMPDRPDWMPFADLWFSPKTGDDLERCPFVRKRRGVEKYDCLIYDTRPQVCRDYPGNVGHMKFVRCEMLEPGDTDADVLAFMEKQQ